MPGETWLQHWAQRARIFVAIRFFCTSPTNSSDPGCGPNGPSITYTHINIEVWTDTYRSSWDAIQAKYPDMAPKNLGNSGYYGASAMFVPSAVQERAYEAEGSNLDFYRDYNVTWNNPSRYFTSPGNVDVSQLLPCTDTALMLDEAGVPNANLDQQFSKNVSYLVISCHQTETHSLCSVWCMLQVMGNYLSITGDTAGVVVGGAGVTGQCFQDYFWLAPACRQQASSCFLWFTGGNGWGMSEMLVKATSYNMPLATAVASNFSNYGELPLAYDMMLFWWVPDPTFLRPWLLKLDWYRLIVDCCYIC